MQAKTRTWQKPELTVLVRNRPEETVLAACKSASVPSATGPAGKLCLNSNNNCRNSSTS